MQLAEIFCDSMILQREKEICIFGTGRGEGSIVFCGKTTDFVSTDDKFFVYLPSEKAGGPYEMTVTLNGKTTVFKDILIGDVYIAAGQSNMGLMLSDTADIELVDNPNLRFYLEPHDSNHDLDISYDYYGWEKFEGENPLHMSAIGYYFAHRVYDKTDIPIGIICCYKGASRIDAWMSPELTNSERCQKLLTGPTAEYKFNLDNWLFLNKLLPIVPYTANGILWYQGESSSMEEQAWNHKHLLEMLINEWRALWNDEFPFYIIQLADNSQHPGNWNAIRICQEWVTKNVNNTYLITQNRTGESKLIHPMRKKFVSKLLANAVLNTLYGFDLEYSGPVVDKYEKTDNGLKIYFSHANNMYIDGEYLEDIVGYTDEWIPSSVNAKVNGNILEIEFLVKNFKAKVVTLGAMNTLSHNLYNEHGYLAAPFYIVLD